MRAVDALSDVLDFILHANPVPGDMLGTPEVERTYLLALTPGLKVRLQGLNWWRDGLYSVKRVNKIPQLGHLVLNPWV